MADTYISYRSFKVSLKLTPYIGDGNDISDIKGRLTTAESV